MRVAKSSAEPSRPADDEPDPGARWVKRRAAASMQIEKAALELFLERGVDAVTVEEIAAAAGISRRTFYRYFESPDEILAAMPHRSLHRISDDFSARPMDEHILDSFMAALRAARFTEEERTLHLLAQSVMRRSPEAWTRAMGLMQPDATHVYQDMIAARLRKQGGNPASAGVVAATLSGVMMQVCREVGSTKLFNADQIEQGFAAMLEVMAGAKPKRARRAPTKTRK